MRITFSKSFFIILAIIPLFTFANLEITTTINGPEITAPKLTDDLRDRKSEGFWYYKFITGNPEISPPLPGFGIGYRGIDQSGGLDVSISLIGRKRCGFQFLAPKISYLKTLTQAKDTQNYMSFGLAWGGSNHFWGILAHAGIGHNFTSSKTFADLTIYQPAVPILTTEKTSFIPNLEVSLGTGF